MVVFPGSAGILRAFCRLQVGRAGERVKKSRGGAGPRRFAREICHSPRSPRLRVTFLHSLGCPLSRRRIRVREIRLFTFCYSCLLFATRKRTSNSKIEFTCCQPVFGCSLRDRVPKMIRQAKSLESMHECIMVELRGICCCGAVDGIGIEVNWERPSGFTNWWVTRIRYQNTAFPHADIAASENEISRIEALLQARYFIEPNDGFSRGTRV